MSHYKRMRDELLKKPVADFKVHGGMKVSELVEYFKECGGFTAVDIAKAVEILYEAFQDEECTRIISFPACIVATGLRGVIADLIGKGLIHIIITTGGTIDHDLARSFGGKYYHGSFTMDDIMLRKLNIHRLGNILIPLENYGPLIERVTRRMLDDIISKTGKKHFALYELLHEIGVRIKDENSILAKAARRNVKVIVPGYVDSAFGTALFIYSQLREFRIDYFKDMKFMADAIWEAKKLCALMIGGGISKHHTIWWSQFRGGLDYAVYITTAVEYDGSLSGARLREAISWGKLKAKAKHVTIFGEATVILPLIVAALYDKLGL